MYTFVLAIHNIFRWIILIVGVIAVVKALIGWFGKKPWGKVDDQLGLFFTISLDIQLLLGVILYFFLSPITSSAFNNMAAAMADSDVRFFVVEHFLMMVVAVVLAHVGRIFAKRNDVPVKKHRVTAIFFLLAMAAILLAIPWSRSFLPIF